MTSPREVIYQALFDLMVATVGSVTPFVTTSRRQTMWTQVPAEQQPALFQGEWKEQAIVDGRGIPTKWQLDVEEWIYTSVGQDPTAIPSTLQNNILDLVEQKFPLGIESGQKQLSQTLGISGVSSVRIFGEVMKHANPLSGQAILLIPIRIVAV